ncbi:hypothetical protein C0993_003162, partial [Termitomyces sp. T159_Od127]
RPSLQRRAWLLAPARHFSYVNPFPIPFPYDIDPPGPNDPPAAQSISVHLHTNAVLHIHDSKLHDTPRVLLGIAPTALRDCLPDCFPHLDVGDAFAVLGSEHGPASPEAVSAREELVDIISGYSVLATPKDANDSRAFPPWSLRYSRHQFGSWAGQLGDGRAVSILITPHPSDPSRSIELQLKGAGRTPFLRTVDGLAVVRSSISCPAMHAFRIPTTRVLSLPVQRERTESACILTRLAPSFIRIENFEAMIGPTNTVF